MSALPNNSKRPILLIRGLLRETRHWGRFTELLQAAFPGREIIAFDIAGNGPRYQEQSSTSVSAMVEDLKSQLSDYQASTANTTLTDFNADSVDIIAISMGGMIALEWMRKYPNDVHSAILINASLSNYSPFYKRLNWQQYTNVFRYFFASTTEQESLIFAMTTRQSSRSVVGCWIEWRRAYPVSTSNALRQLYAASRYRFKATPSSTTLLIGSQKDALVDISCSKSLARAWHIPLFIHPEAGHDLPLDDPSWLLDKVAMFYQRQDN